VMSPQFLTVMVSESTAFLPDTPSSPARSRRDVQTQGVNEKAARLAAVKPWRDVYAAFPLAAHLATEAIGATTEL
jgi:hypothetical protein